MMFDCGNRSKRNKRQKNVYTSGKYTRRRNQVENTKRKTFLQTILINGSNRDPLSLASRLFPRLIIAFVRFHRTD